MLGEKNLKHYIKAILIILILYVLVLGTFGLQDSQSDNQLIEVSNEVDDTIITEVKSNDNPEPEIKNKPDLKVDYEIQEIKKLKKFLFEKYNKSNVQRSGINDIEIKISVAGDMTLGTDGDYGYHNSFVEEVKKQNNDYHHFVEYIKPIFEQDDLTIANLETTLTTATKKANKKFKFKGDPSFVQFLNVGSVDVVNIANNHTYDYLQQGFDDTINALQEAEVGFFGYNYIYTTEIKGIDIGVLGYTGWDSSDKFKTKLQEDISNLKEKVDLVIVSFHWGIENRYYPNEVQKELAHYSIDNGVDLVFGHHPHVIQGIENYNGKYIVYSLGNFLYGGHRNPSDKDTFIFQQTFYFDYQKNLLPKNDINIIPFSISSVDWRNNYKPTPLEGEEKERLLNKIREISSVFPNSF